MTSELTKMEISGGAVGSMGLFSGLEVADVQLLPVHLDAGLVIGFEPFATLGEVLADSLEASSVIGVPPYVSIVLTAASRSDRGPSVIAGVAVTMVDLMGGIVTSDELVDDPVQEIEAVVDADAHIPPLIRFADCLSVMLPANDASLFAVGNKLSQPRLGG
jgi:hypothetical protein